jgi:ATP adenylyltransferase
MDPFSRLNEFSFETSNTTNAEFQSQSTPLLPTDLLAAYKLLKAAQSAGRPMFAFYNCGDRSGASQAHKHMQFLPLEDPDGFPTEKLAKNAKMTDECNLLS